MTSQIRATLPLDELHDDPDATPLKGWQLKRDLVIVAALNSGASTEILATVFDLSVRRIEQIHQRIEKRYAPKSHHQSPSGQPRHPRKFVA